MSKRSVKCWMLFAAERPAVGWKSVLGGEYTTCFETPANPLWRRVTITYQDGKPSRRRARKGGGR